MRLSISQDEVENGGSRSVGIDAQSRRILIIEDDEDYQRLVSVALARSREAFEVKTAGTLAEGARIAEAVSSRDHSGGLESTRQRGL